jgi:hypothetical protein
VQERRTAAAQRDLAQAQAAQGRRAEELTAKALAEERKYGEHSSMPNVSAAGVKISAHHHLLVPLHTHD